MPSNIRSSTPSATILEDYKLRRFEDSSARQTLEFSAHVLKFISKAFIRSDDNNPASFLPETYTARQKVSCDYPPFQQSDCIPEIRMAELQSGSSLCRISRSHNIKGNENKREKRGREKNSSVSLLTNKTEYSSERRKNSA